MSPSTEENPKHPTQLFSVIGAAYVPEDHADDNRHPTKLSEVRQPETGVAGVWLVFYALLIGISLENSGSAAKLVEFASVTMK
jgi:hypothetical protein